MLNSSVLHSSVLHSNVLHSNVLNSSVREADGNAIEAGGEGSAGRGEEYYIQTGSKLSILYLYFKLSTSARDKGMFCRREAKPSLVYEGGSLSKLDLGKNGVKNAHDFQHL